MLLASGSRGPKSFVLILLGALATCTADVIDPDSAFTAAGAGPDDASRGYRDQIDSVVNDGETIPGAADGSGGKDDGAAGTSGKNDAAIADVAPAGSPFVYVGSRAEIRVFQLDVASGNLVMRSSIQGSRGAKSWYGNVSVSVGR
jgi:hypothetical protein